VTPYLGIDNLIFENSHNIGTIGIKGTRAANLDMQNFELVTASSLILFLRLITIWFVTLLGFIATYFISKK